MKNTGGSCRAGIDGESAGRERGRVRHGEYKHVSVMHRRSKTKKGKGQVCHQVTLRSEICMNSSSYSPICVSPCPRVLRRDLALELAIIYVTVNPQCNPHTPEEVNASLSQCAQGDLLFMLRYPSTTTPVTCQELPYSQVCGLVRN